MKTVKPEVGKQYYLRVTFTEDDKTKLPYRVKFEDFASIYLHKEVPFYLPDEPKQQQSSGCFESESGKEYEFSDNGVDWYKRLFIGQKPVVSKHPFAACDQYGTLASWVLMRPIQSLRERIAAILCLSTCDHSVDKIMEEIEKK